MTGAGKAIVTIGTNGRARFAQVVAAYHHPIVMIASFVVSGDT